MTAGEVLSRAAERIRGGATVCTPELVAALSEWLDREALMSTPGSDALAVAAAINTDRQSADSASAIECVARRVAPATRLHLVAEPVPDYPSLWHVFYRNDAHPSEMPGSDHIVDIRSLIAYPIPVSTTPDVYCARIEASLTVRDHEENA